MKVDVKDDHELVYEVELEITKTSKKLKDMLIMTVTTNWANLKLKMEKPAFDVNNLDNLVLTFSLTNKDGNKALVTIANETPAERRLIEGMHPDFITSAARTHKVMYIHPTARKRMGVVSKWKFPVK